MFERSTEYTFPTKNGWLRFFGCTTEEWAHIGMQHTKRNQRKSARFSRFYRGIA